jgi:hypothetical protein
MNQQYDSIPITGVIDTGGKSAAGVVDASSKFTTGVFDTGGATSLANISRIFGKIGNDS